MGRRGRTLGYAHQVLSLRLVATTRVVVGDRLAEQVHIVRRVAARCRSCRQPAAEPARGKRRAVELIARQVGAQDFEGEHHWLRDCLRGGLAARRTHRHEAGVAEAVHRIVCEHHHIIVRPWSTRRLERAGRSVALYVRLLGSRPSRSLGHRRRYCCCCRGLLHCSRHPCTRRRRAHPGANLGASCAGGRGSGAGYSSLAVHSRDAPGAVAVVGSAHVALCAVRARLQVQVVRRADNALAHAVREVQAVGYSTPICAAPHVAHGRELCL